MIDIETVVQAAGKEDVEGLEPGSLLTSTPRDKDHGPDHAG